MASDAKSGNSMRSQPGAKTGVSSSRSAVDSSAPKKKAVEGSVGTSAADSKATSSSISASKKMKTQSTVVQSKVVTKTRQKKVYSLPGQKFDVPEEREPMRIFYESLSKQIPSSEMAAFWLMEHGLLSPERAKKAYERKQRKQKELRTSTPVKSPPPAPPKPKPESSKKPQAMPKNGEVMGKKRAPSDSDDDTPLSFRRRKL